MLKLQFKTIKAYLAGIRHFYIIDLGVNPMISRQGAPLELLAITLRGIRKRQIVVKSTRLPISREILTGMCTLLGQGIFEPYTSALAKAAATLAFFGLLRCGEFTSCDLSHEPALSIGDVSIFQEKTGAGISVNIRASKTDPFRAGCVIKVCQTGGIACPVEAMTQFLKHRAATFSQNNGPLFKQVDGRPLTRSAFVAIIRVILQRMGLNPDCYAGHSFRIGGATAAAEANIPDHLIKTLGRWSSDCYQTYIRTPLSLIREAQVKMAGQVPRMLSANSARERTAHTPSRRQR